MWTYIILFLLSVVVMLLGGTPLKNVITFSALALPAVSFLSSVLFVVNDKKDNKFKAYLISQAFGILNLFAILIIKYFSDKYGLEVNVSIWGFSLWISASVIFLNLTLNIAIVALSRD